MMKAIKNFMNKPITWGDSFKWSGTFPVLIVDSAQLKQVRF